MTAPTVYRSPLYYDVAYGWDPASEVATVEGCLRAFGRVAAPARLYEPGSGSGRLLLAFAGRGYEATGLDGSVEMNAYAAARAEERGLSSRVRVETGRMESVPAGPACDGAYCALSTFRYLVGDADVLSHLRTLGARLLPGAAYVLDTRLAEDAPRTPMRESWRAEREGIRLACRWEMDMPGGSGAGRERLTLEVEEDGRRFVLSEESPCRLDRRETFESLVRDSGAFEVAGYLGPARDPGRPVPEERAQGRVVAVLRRR